MDFKIVSINEVDWDQFEKVTPYSIFSQPKVFKICIDTFEADYRFAILSENDEIKAYLPLVIQSGHIGMIGYYEDHDLFDFAPLNYTELSHLVELVAHLRDWARSQNLELVLRELPLEIVRANDSLEFIKENDAIVPVCNIDMNLQAQEGKPIFKKKHRKEMRRKINRVNSEGIKYNIEIVTDDKVSAQAKFIEFFSKSPNDEKQKFIESKASEYFSRLIELEEVRLSVMRFNSEIVSVLLYFENNPYWHKDKTHRKVLYLYNMASDPEYYDYSPGLIHVNSVIMDVIKLGYDEFNFLRGAERYKFEIGANACNWNVKLVSK